MPSKFNEIYSTKFGSLLLDTFSLIIMIANLNDDVHELDDELTEQLAICGLIYTRIIMDHYKLNEQDAKQLVADLAEHYNKVITSKLN